MSTSSEIFRSNQIFCVEALVQSMSGYNSLMVLCEDRQSQSLFVVHVLKILTTYIDRSQFNYIQRVKQSQMTHFSTKKLGRWKVFLQLLQLCTETL